MRNRIIRNNLCTKPWRTYFKANTPGITRAAYFSTMLILQKPMETHAFTSEINHHRPEYLFIEKADPAERYRPGGYRPVTIGERINGRYDIVHKLGFGGYSTTWLARDQRTRTYVVIKIEINRAEPKDTEIMRLLHDIHTKESQTPGSSALAPVLNVFNLNGPNGSHRCLVTTPRRMSLEDAKDASIPRLFQLPVARAVAAQLLQAVALLHARGIVHGDLHLGNILFRLPLSLDNLTIQQLYENYGCPQSMPIERIDGLPLSPGVPSDSVVPAWLGTSSDKFLLSEAQILLIDFGESFKPGSSPNRYRSNTPALFLPPETYFLPDEPISFPADIWGLACTIWSIFGQRPIFEALAPTRDWMIKEHVDVLGKLPDEWWQQWEARSDYYEGDGSRKWDPIGKEWTSWFEFCTQIPRERFGMKQVGEEEKEALSTLLRAMLAFRPEHRLSAEQAMCSDWMLRWGLPELSAMGKRQTTAVP